MNLYLVASLGVLVGAVIAVVLSRVDSPNKIVFVCFLVVMAACDQVSRHVDIVCYVLLGAVSIFLLVCGVIGFTLALLLIAVAVGLVVSTCYLSLTQRS